MKQYTDFDNHVEHRIRELEHDNKVHVDARELLLGRIDKAKAILEDMCRDYMGSH